MIDGRRRKAAEQHGSAATARPTGLGGRLAAIGVSANAVTAAGVVLAAVTAVVIGLGHLWTGVALLIAGGLMDTLDGVVAKAAGTSSPRGAFVDSVSDRLADALIFGGLAWHLLVGRDPKLAILPVAILGVGSIVSYERAKAESLGFQAHGGLMERAERLILLGVALGFNVVLVPLLGLLLALTALTAAGRFLRVWRPGVRRGRAAEPDRAPPGARRVALAGLARDRSSRRAPLEARPPLPRARSCCALREVLHQDRYRPVRQARPTRPARRERSVAALRRRVD